MPPEMRALLAELANEPIALWPDWIERQAAALLAVIHPATERAIARREGSVAVIAVQGVILPKPHWAEGYGLATSVVRLAAAVKAAAADPDVKAIVLDVDSPGGRVSGVPEFAAELRALRGTKPIIAQVDHMAASAAYWIAAQADEIVASPSSLTGSIGVILMHADFSKQLEQEGIKVTFVSAGKFKVEANPYEPLGDEAKGALQVMVDQTMGLFVADVAAGRDDTPAAVREGYGQGRILMADSALAAGLVDKVRTLEGTLAALGVGAGPSPGARAAAGTGRRARALRLLEI